MALGVECSNSTLWEPTKGEVALRLSPTVPSYRRQRVDWGECRGKKNNPVTRGEVLMVITVYFPS